MRATAILLLLIAVGLGVWGLVFDPSVATDSTTSLLPDRIVNLDMVSWRIVIFIGAGAFFAGSLANFAAADAADAIAKQVATLKPDSAPQAPDAETVGG